MTPQRITLSRAKGWKMPPDTVKVTRPGPWGNPFTVRPGVKDSPRCVPTAEDAVACYREMFNYPGETADWLREHLPELRGKNLACWCKPGEPCHADVLLEIANRPSAPKADVGGEA